MKEYSKNPKCEKCEAEDVKVKYCEENTTYRIPSTMHMETSSVDFLSMTCLNCGYIWRSRTADYKEIQLPSFSL